MLTPTGAERSTPKHSPSRNQWRATLRRCHRTWRATLRRPHLEGNAPSLPPHGRDDLRVVRITRPIKPRTRCARLVNPFAPPSGYSCHAISKSRSPASSALPVVRRAAHKWAPGTPPFASLRPSAISALSRYVASLSKAQAPARHPLHATVPAASLTLAPLPASQRLSSYLARRFLLVNGYARSFAGTVAISYRYLQLDISLDLSTPPRVLRRLSLWSLNAPSDTLLQTLCNATIPPCPAQTILMVARCSLG